MALGPEHQGLVLAAQSGDPSALERLLTICQLDVRRYAQRHCYATIVDDAVQEALLIVTRQLQGLKAAEAFTSWLFTVIRRECRRLERAMFRNEPLDEAVLEKQIASRDDVALRIDLARALESLPPHYLTVVLLRDFEELTISEISERLAEPSGAIKSRLHRARELVREYLTNAEAN